MKDSAMLSGTSAEEIELVNNAVRFRLEILGVMIWGQLISLLSEAYRKDIANFGEKLTISMWLWDEAQKWKVLGAYILILGLAWIIPHQALTKLMLTEVYSIPVGYMGISAIGFLADDIFFALDSLARRYIKGRFNGQGYGDRGVNGFNGRNSVNSVNSVGRDMDGGGNGESGEDRK